METDWSSTTDASRAEAITTSVDSTTDSTGEALPHRLHQMKADSGYKSLETSAGKSSFIVKSTQESFESQKEEKVEEVEEEEEIRHSHSPWVRVSSERRNSSRLTAKKRRELLQEWQHTSLDAGIALEPETNSGDESSGKRSVLARFLRTHRSQGSPLRPGQLRLLQRDYSIDEKSDRLFKEFSQAEIALEGEPSSSGRKTRLPSGRRLPRRLEPGDSSPRSNRRKLSPQDSIEEEDQIWEDEEELQVREGLLLPTDSQFSLMERNG